MLGRLAPRYRLTWLEAIGTDPRFPVTDGWPRLVEQLVESLESLGHPVIGVGHSLGGFLTFIAAARRPELFRAVVLLDAPVFGALRGRMLAAAKRLGLGDRVTPAGATRERRSRWPSREQALAHFRARPLFRRFATQCLEDYVRHGLVEDGAGGVRLVIDPRIESRIYGTVPHDVSRHLRALRVPAGFIGGADSDVVRRAGLGAMRGRLLIARTSGGHLFPLEHPQEAAAALERMVHALVGG